VEPKFKKKKDRKVEVGGYLRRKGPTGKLGRMTEGNGGEYNKSTLHMKGKWRSRKETH
jgi:hypothetical protein